uniref:Helicase ATP-binding domain-containing protein n=1 Tax=Panagrolaimus sp. ES5 TaxID=591445 RepID=A0AC34GD45_9BILA
MPVEPILEYLKTSPESAYRSVYEKLKNYTEPETVADLSMSGKFFHDWKCRCQILIELITAKPKKHKPEHWYLEFLKACNTSPKTRPIAMVLERDFRDMVEKYEIEISQLTKPVHRSEKDFVDPSEAPTSPRPQKQFGTYPPEITGAYSGNYDLREYQRELIKKANEGFNTIICAPTGSGKTLVAADIIAFHLRRLRHAERVGRVVMFVPTIPLVNQQSSHLSTNLRPEFYVEKLSGAERSSEKSDDVRKAATLLKADIVVLTPQIFINMLLSPLRSQKIYLQDFTMFVFDECHHCNEQHPYNVLMNLVRESEYKPQIVGLTASVGDGGD